MLNALQNFFTVGGLSSIFNMLTGLQLIVHLPLINVQFPANAFIVFKELVKLSTYDMVPAEEIYPFFMDLPEREPLNEKFVRSSYGDFYMPMNLGFVFLVLVWQLSLYPVFLIFWLINLKFAWPSRVVTRMKKFLFWKQILIFTYANFLELVINIIIQAKIADSYWLETDWVLISFMIWTLAIILVIQLSFILLVKHPFVLRAGKDAQENNQKLN